MPLVSGPPVGLDIGTSAVRAAQVGSGRGGRTLQAFGQVPLPPGVVVDGEIRDQGALSEAIAQLFKRIKMPSKRAVIGVANQRVIVRQLDLPYLEEKELRASLRYLVADHIPMPVDDAELDFQAVGEFQTDEGDRMMRVLLVAAGREMVEGFVGAVAAAGLEPAAVDLTPFAVARAVSAAARGEVGLAGAEAIVDVGAGVTNIVVHVGGEPRFVRILLIGGDEVTQALAGELGLGFEEAEALKLDLGRAVMNPQAEAVLERSVGQLVEEIRGSLDYYLSQADSEPVSQVVVTGGGSLTRGLLPRLEQILRVPVRVGAPLAELNYAKSGLTDEQVVQVEPVIAAAVGLAMGAAS
jgi:type IV pilus assembly protein PilM